MNPKDKIRAALISAQRAYRFKIPDSDTPFDATLKLLDDCVVIKMDDVPDDIDEVSEEFEGYIAFLNTETGAKLIKAAQLLSQAMETDDE